jgi:NADPH-dependent 2,4-dienoyl-CoA reductase/sulfur reductase-like enzyme
MVRPVLEAVVIVGASLAGLRCAEALRDRGYAGRLTLVGAESRMPYADPPLSKEVPRGARTQRRSPCAARGARGTRARPAPWRCRRLPRSRRARRAQAESGRFDGLAIATPTPRCLPARRCSPASGLRTLDDTCVARRARAGPRPVVGAGFIGAGRRAAAGSAG